MKIAIIGSGISGISLAKILKNKKKDVVLFEKQNKPGGLIKCDLTDTALFHKVGGHVFNSKNKDVLDWFWQYFDKETEFTKIARNAKILLQNKTIGYPIENYIYNLPKETVEKVTSELLELDKEDKLSPLTYPNFEEFLKKNFGNTLYNIYFGPYNNKIWKTDLSSIPMPWLEGKLPMPDINEIFVRNILKEEEGQMVHSSFFYPKKGGSQFIADRLSQELDIRLCEDIMHIEKNDGKFTVAGEKGFDSVVFSGDIRRLPDYMEQTLSEKMNLKEIKSLKSNGISNLLCETDDNDMSWMYIPENFTDAYRIIYTGNFSPANNGTHKRKTCVVEFSGEAGYKTMTEEIKKLPGNLSPIAYNFEPNSYIVHNKDTKNIINTAKKILAEENIYLLGRFAEWEYYNMDKCIEAAMKLSGRL